MGGLSVKVCLKNAQEKEKEGAESRKISDDSHDGTQGMPAISSGKGHGEGWLWRKRRMTRMNEEGKEEWQKQDKTIKEIQKVKTKQNEYQQDNRKWKGG